MKIAHPSPDTPRTITDVMTSHVVTVDLDARLKDIQTLFENRGIHHVLVVDEGELLGVISDRDVLSALSPFVNTASEQLRDLNTLKRRAHQVMSRDPVTVTRETDIHEAAALLLEHDISCLPVLSEDAQLEGIVTWRDLLGASL